MTDTTGPAPVERTLTRGQSALLVCATLPMVAFGALGGWGTYTNITSVFHRGATAIGVVAAGEGATLVLALVMVVLTMFGQSAPAPVRIGLWTLPAIASAVGAAVAPTLTERVVFAVTPMAMCVAAEGIGLLARRLVIYRTGVDMEAQRRNAKVVQQIAVQRALATNHPEEEARKDAELKSWKLAKKVGQGDDGLGGNLISVQRERMTDGADTALADMFASAATGSGTPALPSGAERDGHGTAGVTPAALERGADTATVTAPAHRHTPGTGGGTGAARGVTQTEGPSGTVAVTPGGTPPVTGHTPGGVTDTDPSGEASHGARAETLAGLAAVAGVPTPVTGAQLGDTQLAVVLRHMRHGEDPPRSYRQAVACFREEGFVGSEKRLRKTWGALMSEEEEATTEARHDGQEDEDSEQDDDAQEPHRP
ncbi:hypothetical protein [Streptomyces sp. WMMB303]|uniref:hypothetical protein n=1 Tax=Streptomyces sp. WMMB303 TaxID=3034154 RepID=UPI0023EB97FC|nr:hypothetical protein [Streptomyces sp. WMMB303]MDF4254624.1 hypothetical protein [Streptomyces sp. WMMB303]